MSEETADLIIDALHEPVPAIGYYLSRRLAALHPDKAIFEGNTPSFDLEGYAKAGHCSLTERAVPHSHRLVYWMGHEQGHLERPQNTLFDVTWDGEKIQVLVMHWQDGMSQPYHYCIIVRDRQIAERFHLAVCEWANPIPEHYIMVFDINGWNRDETLLAAIRNATLDNLVLRGGLKRDILADINSFFDARDTYLEYGVPWKRGVLFVGPAGNGKTHAVKALINALGQRCLYVKTFAFRGGPDQMGIMAIFQQARTMAPCVLVLEDLDSLITPQNRSYFLNELDGFAGNDGLLTLATTNHPDRLDPAILNRPSRFDRKYPFDLPAIEERATYIAQWNASLRPPLRVSDDTLTILAEETDGFSFAYLKELFLSAMMRWISIPEPGAMDAVMAEQLPVLRDQMASIEDLPSDPGYGTPAGPHPGMLRRGRGGRMGPPGPPEIPM